MFNCSGAYGDFLKSMVYGGMDGIITTFAIVCAASGANKDEATIVTMVSYVLLKFLYVQINTRFGVVLHRVLLT